MLAAMGGYQYSFADPIRSMLRGLGIDMSEPYWQERKEQAIPVLNASPRRLMQTLGTEWGRELIHPDIWLTLAQQRLLSNGPGMIVSDVRFENEAAWVRKCGGLIVHIERPGLAGVEAHTSESGVQRGPGDMVLINNGTLEGLQSAVRELCSVYQA